MNALVNRILENRNGHYCHALELSSSEDYKSVIETIYSENVEEFGKEAIKDFFNTIELYYYVDADDDENTANVEDEEQLYNLDVNEFIDNL